MFAGSPVVRAQRDPQPLRDHRRVPGLDEMLTAFDFEPIFRANVTQKVTTPRPMAPTQSSRCAATGRRSNGWTWCLARAQTLNPIGRRGILGMKMDVPIFVAPSSGQGALHPDGESGMHMGATAARTTMIVASGRSVPLEKIAAAADGPLWYSIIRSQSGRAALILEKAQGLGCRAVVVTVDGRAGRVRARSTRSASGREHAPGGQACGRLPRPTPIG